MRRVDMYTNGRRIRCRSLLLSIYNNPATSESMITSLADPANPTVLNNDPSAPHGRDK